MAVEFFNLKRAYICLSTDTKPAHPAHRLLYVTDTQAWFAWNGTTWVSYRGF